MDTTTYRTDVMKVFFGCKTEDINVENVVKCVVKNRKTDCKDFEK